jgi:biotin-dependent carboxylase-like uncharacterized protein
MSAVLRILATGPGVSVQDAGRRGFQRFGVTPAGPMDAPAFAAACLAAGAGAAIEVSLGGVTLAAEGESVSLAIAGGAFAVTLDGAALPGACVVRLAPGSRLTLRPGAGGAWCYVAPVARIALPDVLGSLATHVRSGLGGMEGRALRAGDALPLAELREGPAAPQALSAPWLERPPAPLRVLLGPQQDYFTPEAITALLGETWRLSPQSDRMAYLLEGPRLAHARGHDIVSDGVAFGAIQVPGEGAPLALMADRQPTGGYPKIAHVIGADLGRLAQMRPGETLTFQLAALEEAVAARRALSAAMRAGVTLTDAARRDFDAEALLGANLVGGVVSATDGEGG